MTRPPLVQLEQVTVELGGRPILHDLCWRLRPGQHWVILGRNGSGKSTFLRLVRGELWPAPGQAGRRVYHLDGQPQCTAVGVKPSFAVVSPELQHRYLQQEWTRTVGDVVQSGVGGGDYSYRALTLAERARVTRALEWMQVTHLARRNVQELSTGELRRVLIARALAGRPRVLACDEIGDGLDAASRATLLSALDAAARGGTQLLLSTHRGNEIPLAMTHQLVLDDGRIVAQGRIGSGRERLHPGRWFAEAQSFHRVPARLPALDTVAASARTDAGRPLIQIQHASVYLGDKPTLRDINLEICQGQHWAILGPNGSGKSTLLKLLSGDVHPALGARVQRFAFTPRNTLWQLRARLGMVSPELQAAYCEPTSGADVVASGFFSSVGLRRRPSAAQWRQVRQTLAAIHSSALAERNFLEMSYGEARRILLARALVKRPALLLFDEPFDGLDVGARRHMAATLEHAAATGATLVIVTHHEEDLPGCITHVGRLADGRLTTAGGRLTTVVTPAAAVR